MSSTITKGTIKALRHKVPKGAQNWSRILPSINVSLEDDILDGSHKYENARDWWRSQFLRAAHGTIQSHPNLRVKYPHVNKDSLGIDLFMLGSLDTLVWGLTRR